MSVSVALSAAAMANSAAALAAASAARKTACTAFINTYDAAHATIDQMQEYASCVQELYPHAMSPNGVWVAKAFVLSSVIGIGIALYKGREDYMFEGAIGKFMLVALGAVSGPIVLGALIAAIAGLGFLVS